ncbi:MAG: YciC family protein [Candidatus Bathyarchaeia archaeon]
MEKPSHELSIGEILSLTLNLYLSKFLPFFLPFLIAGIIIGLSTYVITSSFPIPAPPGATPSYEELIEWFFAFLSAVIVIGILSVLVSWIVGTTTTGVAIKYASDQIEKGTSNFGVSFNFAVSKLPSLLVAQFVAGILIAIGLLLFIVPGIIIAIMFSLVIPAIIVEQQGVFESLGRSRRLVSNRWLKTFALLLILGIIVGIVNGVASVLAMSFNLIHPIINPLLTNIISAFIAPIYPIAITYLYYAMVAREIPLPQPPPPPF